MYLISSAVMHDASGTEARGDVGRDRENRGVLYKENWKMYVSRDLRWWGWY
jgi:hypothetical protein